MFVMRLLFGRGHKENVVGCVLGCDGPQKMHRKKLLLEERAGRGGGGPYEILCGRTSIDLINLMLKDKL